MNITDRETVRDLAKALAEVAALPIMEERKREWVRHNRLESRRPMILIFPEGAWEELLPQSALVCEGDGARRIEWELRRRLYHHDHLDDDTVIEGAWRVSAAVTVSGWGVAPVQIPSTASRGAYRYDPVIRSRSDLDQLTMPQVSYDAAETERRLDAAQELLGDILEVRAAGVGRFHFSMMGVLCPLRGLEQVMWDMSEDPELVHHAMAILEEGHRGIVKQTDALHLLSLNNDGTYHCSGGVGYTDELPPLGSDPDRVRPSDMWASAEAQETDQVSPAMLDEFVLPYESRLLEPFGLSGYGCCDDLTYKLDSVCRMPHMRRISISPFANVDSCAEQLEDRFIFSWKPQPSHLVGTFDDDLVRGYIQHTLDVAGDCVLEIILKDTHTCEHHPERFDRWTAIARELVDAA